MHDLIAVGNDTAASSGTIEISVRGKWVGAPMLRVNAQELVTQGTWLKIASMHDEDWAETAIADPDACIARLKERTAAPRADIFSYCQKVPDTVAHYNYPMEMRSIAVAHVARFRDWWDGISRETRRNIKLAEKRGVHTRIRSLGTDVIEGIREIQNETPIRQGRRYRHYGKSFEEVQRDYSSFADRSDLICAYFEDELIGFIKLVYRGDVASILQLNTKMAHYDKRTANGLLAKAVEICEERKIAYLTYGLYNYGNKGNSSLRQFKERHGFQEMLTPNYYVPLTLWGGFCVRTKLYRGLKGMLPPRLIDAALKAREKWYKARTASSAAA